MKILESDLEKLIDLNETLLTNVDLEYLNIIKTIYYGFGKKMSKIDMDKKLDKLWKIRMTSKLLWSNGSLSTHTYTSHNEKHGDMLVSRFIQLNRAAPFFRNIISKEKYSIFSLIGSFYTHDLGMLLNGNVESTYNGTLKEIYKKISDESRTFHGRNSSSILLEWLGGFLNIDAIEVSIMSFSAIAHETGIDSLPKCSNKVIINSLILSIVDLLDITQERSTLLSRKLTGNIASNDSIIHWIKHYFVKEITDMSMVKNEKKINFKITLKYNKFNDKFNDKLKKIVEWSVKKYMKENLKNLFKYEYYNNEYYDICICFIFNEENDNNRKLDLNFYKCLNDIDEKKMMELLNDFIKDQKI
ncbi:MAG: hypothetical protein HRT99_02845 [Mycoplasmatales bacterium]|nr:hypothetical protein [Mycoplasmatales bacterium]